MDEIKAIWTGFSLLEKIGCILLAPLGLIYLYFKVSGSINAAQDNHERKEVDAKASDLQTKEQAISLDTSKEEGKLEQLNEDKTKAVASAETQDAANFYNNRPKSD